MRNHEESLGKFNLSPIIWAALLVVLSSIGCQKSASSLQSAAELGDRKVATEQVAAAEPLYGQREDLAKIRSALALLRQAKTADPESYDAAWKLARATYYLGEHTTNDSERDDLFLEGIEAGKAAIQIQPNKPDGHFWLGANYGGKAEHGTLSSLSSVQDISRQMEAVLKLDESYESGSAYMALGQLYLKAPRVLGGDTAKAIGFLEKGLTFGPKNALLRLRLAEGYEATNRDADARKQIEIILAMGPVPGYAPEQQDAIAGAKKLQEKIAAK